MRSLLPSIQNVGDFRSWGDDPSSMLIGAAAGRAALPQSDAGVVDDARDRSVLRREPTGDKGSSGLEMDGSGVSVCRFAKVMPCSKVIAETRNPETLKPSDAL